jgi:anti-anti-sigma regulatory factor
MPIELLTSGAQWSMVLDGAVDIFDVAAVHATALDAVAGAPEGVTVMLGGVTVIDTAVTQVLLALKRALAGSGRTCILDEVPPSVLETWTLAGLAPALT